MEIKAFTKIISKNQPKNSITEKETIENNRDTTTLWFYSFIPFKIATGGTSPLIPLLILENGGTPVDVGLANGIGSIFSMFGGILWGRLSDRLRRRKIFLIIGFISVSLFGLLFALTKTPTDVIKVNALYSLFIATTIPIPVIIIANTLKKEYWDYGIGKFNEIGGWAWVLGLVIGLILSPQFTIGDLFIVFSLINLPSIVMAMKWIQEAPIRINRRIFRVYVNTVIEKFKYLPNILIHIPKLNRRVIESFSLLKHFYIANFMFYTGSLMFFSQYPVYLSQRGLNYTYIYLLSVFNSAISAYMYTKAGIITQNIGATRVLIRALFLRIVGISIFITTLFLEGLMFVILAITSLILLGYTWAYIAVSTTSIISKSANENNRGSMMGTYNLIASLGSMSGSFIGGFLVVHFDFMIDFVFAIMIILISILILNGFKVFLPLIVMKRYPMNSRRVVYLVKSLLLIKRF